MTIHFAAANDRDITVLTIYRNGTQSVFRSHLKSHWLDKGHTRTQAALALIEFLTKVEFTKEERGWRSLRRTLSREAQVAEVFFNSSGTSVSLKPLVFYSLDSASVEMWLRRVFQEYRDCLPPIIYSLQQDFECWTTEPWTIAEGTPADLDIQVDAARNTHSFIRQYVAERSQRVEAESARLLEESMQRVSMRLEQQQLAESQQTQQYFGTMS